MTTNKDLINIIILAAGNGTRMKSEKPKVLHTVANKPMLDIVINQAEQLSIKANIICVVSDDVLKYYNTQEQKTNVNFVIQKEKLGTAHAVQTAIKSQYYNKNAQFTLILYGDSPLITTQLLEKLYKITNENYSLAVLAFEEQSRDVRYGRIFANENININQHTQITEIKEFKDFVQNETMPTTCNGGIMCGITQNFIELIPQIQNSNASKEFYLTDIINLAHSKNLKCGMMLCNEEDVLGANSQIELAILEQKMQTRIKNQLMLQGVKFFQPETSYISIDAKISSDVVIEPNVFIGEGVVIEKNTIIKAFSYLEGVRIAQNSQIGPFARIRPNTIIEQNTKVGNFVEIKNSHLGEKTKANHLCYIGDTTTGSNVNFGAGSVICNYDGINKHKTNIENDVFVGSNSTIIAPCTIESNSYIAAGSVISKVVHSFSLAIARSKQTEIANWVKKKFHTK
ncbi:MAG: bifunctional UDP-N-acetylglucosamine diphosphorylase/glucosamine-phosphate N-acetyltransferase [Pseudomonadota bacterium]|jgi:bifunctional UDP-N-acetylglucosamine pyrophosphorylase/glucosamine-1-phosphate N-acetyltransferase